MNQIFFGFTLLGLLIHVLRIFPDTFKARKHQTQGTHYSLVSFIKSKLKNVEAEFIRLKI